MSLGFSPFCCFPTAGRCPRSLHTWAAPFRLLLVYCLRNVDFAAAPHGLPELISIAALTVLHLWKRNGLLSIGVGTVLYMVLVQAVFV